jgi:cell wall-associated NlpC family hydrolase
MASYRYPRYMRSYRRGSTPLGKAALAVGVAAMLAGASHTVAAHAGAHHHHGSPARSAAAAQAISYERHRLGLPYCWGGTGPSCYDCSGLVMEAYGLPYSLRTSGEQWAGLPHIPFGQQEPGDLVFFAGSDGTPAVPGHVGLVLGRHTMIEAYATGFPIRISQYGTAASAPGDTNPVGFARPGGA